MSRAKVMIVAAEASSSLYAQRLLEYWRTQGVDVEAFGVGSQAMENLGFRRIGKSEEMAVVGLQEVLAHWGLIKDTFYKLVDAVKTEKPNVVLLLDYPDFNLRLAKKIQGLDVPIVYYISPQLWAWRTGRIHLIKRVVQKMLVLFPFERDFYEKHQVPVEFVGHPLLDELKSQDEKHRARQLLRSRYGIQDPQQVVGLMPGSRVSELKHNLATQIQAAQLLSRRGQPTAFALLVAPSLSLEQVHAMLPQYDFPLILVKDDPVQMIELADVILCASGTATLLVGLLQKPMVVMYRMNAISAFFAKLFVKGKIPFFAMVNLIMGEKVVEEYFQGEANPQQLAGSLNQLLSNQEYRRKVEGDLARLQEKLGKTGATSRVAKVLETYF